MIRSLTPAQLRAVGIEAVDDVDDVTLPRSADLGLMPAAPTHLERAQTLERAVRAGDVVVARIECPVLRRAALPVFCVGPDAIAIGGTANVRSVVDGCDHVNLFDGDPTTWLFFNPDAVALVTRPAGLAVLIGRSASGFTFGAPRMLQTDAPIVDAQAPRTAPLVPPTMLTTVELDPWLRRLVDEWLQTALPWGHLVGAALVARLALNVDLQGGDARLAQPRTWARSWTAHERESAWRLAAVAVRELREGIDAMVDDVEEDDDVDVACDRFVSLCEDRDDLEAVLLLLDEAGVLDRVQRHVLALDKRAAEVALPVVASNERLRRAAEVDASDGAWWLAFDDDGGDDDDDDNDSNPA